MVKHHVRMQRDLETAKSTSLQLASQLQEANAAAESGTRSSTQAHAENTLLANSYDQLQIQAEQVISERVSLRTCCAPPWRCICSLAPLQGPSECEEPSNVANVAG